MTDLNCIDLAAKNNNEHRIGMGVLSIPFVSYTFTFSYNTCAETVVCVD